MNVRCWSDYLLEERLKDYAEKVKFCKKLLSENQDCFDIIENEILRREYLKHKDCKHEWNDEGICSKCNAKSMLHNKKMGTVIYPYD